MNIRVQEDEILTSALATASYLKSVASPGSRIYVIGEDGIETALREAGFILSNDHIDYVVVGFDRRLTYEKLKIASLAIRAGATFIATNPDTTLPSEEGLAPGNGAILAAITAATGVTPIVIGKPQRAVFEQALARLRATPKDTGVIGDRLETDILGAKSVGLTTIFLFGGASGEEDLKTSKIQPDYIFANIRTLHHALFDLSESD